MSKAIFKTKLGKIICDDSLEYMKNNLKKNSIDLIVTSPPFALLRKKNYGNVPADKYCEWIKPFILEFKRVIKDNGSIVIDIGSTWVEGKPIKSIYQYKMLVMIVEECGLNLVQDYFWWNPAKLPTPAEWVTVRRIRVKNAVNNVYWLAKSPYPKASNKRVLTKYSASMERLLVDGYKPKLRPSGHNISDKFQKDNKGAIPPNLLAIANTKNSDSYTKYCKKNELPIHDARFPADFPKYFINMTTDKDDIVLDPFSGSCITGAVCEELFRKWICIDNDIKFCQGGEGWFKADTKGAKKTKKEIKPYSIYPPLFNGYDNKPLDKSGGKKRKN